LNLFQLIHLNYLSLGLAKIYTEEGNIENANDLLLRAMEINQKQPIISYVLIKDGLFDYN